MNLFKRNRPARYAKFAIAAAVFPGSLFAGHYFDVGWLVNIGVFLLGLVAVVNPIGFFGYAVLGDPDTIVRMLRSGKAPHPLKLPGHEFAVSPTFQISTDAVWTIVLASWGGWWWLAAAVYLFASFCEFAMRLAGAERQEWERFLGGHPHSADEAVARAAGTSNNLADKLKAAGWEVGP